MSEHAAKIWRRRLCWTCLGAGCVAQPTRRAYWPCPYCEGEAHPSLATIKETHDGAE